jgi:hypothetical protein
MPIDVILYRLNSYYFWLFAVLYGLKVIVQLGSNLPRKITLILNVIFHIIIFQI